MSASKNQRLAVAQRRLQVSELYLQGWSQTAIAAQVKVTQSTVSEDIGVIHNQWRTSAIRNLDLAREIELRKLDRLEREAWAAWERSQQPAVPADGSGDTTRQSRQNQVGEARFLDQVNKCIAQRRTLLGLDAPLQVADVTPLIAESPEQRRTRLQQIFQTIVAEAAPCVALEAESVRSQESGGRGQESVVSSQ